MLHNVDYNTALFKLFLHLDHIVSMGRALFIVSLLLAGAYYYAIKSKEKFTAAFLSIGILLLIFIRLYIIFSPQRFNVDECEWLLLAHRLHTCAIPYLCFDAHTTGFINIYLLRLIGFLGLDYNYATLRCFGLFICIIPTIILVYLTVRELYTWKIAVITTGLLINFFIFGCYVANFASYNSEYTLMLITAMAFYLLALYRSRPALLNLILSAILIGAVPYCKIQSIPIAAALFIIFAYEIYRYKAWRQLFIFSIVCLLPSILFLGYFFQIHVFHDFWVMYIATNLLYATKNTVIAHIPGYKFFAFLHLQQVFRFYYLTILAIMALYLVAGSGRRAAIFKLDPAILLLLVSSYYAVYTPGTGYQHYAMLVVVPLFLLFANVASISGLENLLTRRWYLAGFIAWFLLLSIEEIRSSELKDLDYSVQRFEVSKYIQSRTAPSDPVCIIGWNLALIIQVNSERPLATRTGHTFMQKLDDPGMRTYYQQQYINDLSASKPLLVIDPTGELQNPKELAVRNYILQNYTFDKKIDSIDCYKRNF